MDLETAIGNGCARDWETVDPKDIDPVRFAVIGLGWFTKGRALPALEASERCVPSVLVSGSAGKAQTLADDTDGAIRGITYDQFHDGVASDAYDAVYIVTPNALHLEYVETAAAQGKHVLCEKPMERSSERARELESVATSAGVELMIAYRMHTEPAVRRARELVEDGYVGTPMAVDGEMSQRLLDRINPDPDQWRLNEELAGGGALFDIGIYPLNTARFLLNMDPVAVTGTTSSTHDAFDDVDETVSFALRFPNSVTGRCYASHNARQASSITVTGTEGQVRVEPAFFQDQRRTLHVSRGDGRASIELDPVDQMLEEFDYFADRVRGSAELYPDGEHGIDDMEIMETIYEGAEGGRWISLK
ncbi:D-xylose 1-dehydrogenase (NADP(+)) 1 [Halalkalicoccus paucihalophilus]|uniref:D-xylose 1-dehydrogenase (NADP(+)) 1 n=1 Tax=Halalkalicoccus paucihalophilus TaxID=1008153 RepID=A0A151AA90_9EURY|nr:D-xylose 1-dehydrogenase Gfo6 [Halalkalicoccus paucihalophilus]KYH24412.1 D-xylose 1-dehydrogenase (NADP(+)) 1 [Halalkalicoccus paucihalophilus]